MSVNDTHYHQTMKNNASNDMSTFSALPVGSLLSSSAEQSGTSTNVSIVLPSYHALQLVSADNGVLHNGSTNYIRNWTLIFSQGTSRDTELDALQHFVDLMEWYYSPTLATFGIATNLLLIVMLCKSQMCSLSTTPFIVNLALSDTAYLSSLLVTWMDKTQQTHLMSKAGVCHVVQFLLFLGNFLSIWLVICVQVERYISMWHISRRPQQANNRRAKFIACFVGLLGLLLYSCVLWTVGLNPMPGGLVVCVFLPRYFDVYRIFAKADTLISVLMPYSMLPVLNLLILIQVIIKAASVRRHNLPRGAARSSSSDDAHGYVGRIRQQVQSTVSFLIVTTIIWILGMPAQALRMTDFFRFEPQKSIPQREYVYQQICNFPYHLAFAIKFMLYLTFSATFRDAVLDCCRWCDCVCTCKEEGRSSMYEGRDELSPLPSSVPSPLPSPTLSPKHLETVSEV